MGIALSLTGIGFLVLALRVLYQPGAVKESRRQPTATVAVPH
jgi:hypothetical protein